MHNMIRRGRGILGRLPAIKVFSDHQINGVELAMDQKLGRTINEIIDIDGLKTTLVVRAVARKLLTVCKNNPLHIVM
jgi:hypothetical protein